MAGYSVEEFAVEAVEDPDRCDEGSGESWKVYGHWHGEKVEGNEVSGED